MHMHATGSIPFVPPAMNLLWPIFWYATTMTVCCALKNYEVRWYDRALARSYEKSGELDDFADPLR